MEGHAGSLHDAAVRWITGTLPGFAAPPAGLECSGRAAWPAISTFVQEAAATCSNAMQACSPCNWHPAQPKPDRRCMQARCPGGRALGALHRTWRASARSWRCAYMRCGALQLRRLVCSWRSQSRKSACCAVGPPGFVAPVRGSRTNCDVVCTFSLEVGCENINPRWQAGLQQALSVPCG